MASTFGIKVYQYDLDGKFVSEYKSINEAQDLTQVNNICLVLNKKNNKNVHQMGGYFWTHKNYLKLPDKIIDDYNKRLFEKFNVTIYEYDMEGNFIKKWDGLHQITKIRKQRNNIRSVLKGECRTAFDKIYSLKELPKSYFKEHFKIWKGYVLQYDLEGNFIKEWKTSYRASIELKISRTNIDRCLKGQKEYASGYIWKFKD